MKEYRSTSSDFGKSCSGNSQTYRLGLYHHCWWADAKTGWCYPNSGVSKIPPMYSTIDCIAIKLAWGDDTKGPNSWWIFGAQLRKGLFFFIQQIPGGCIWCRFYKHSKYESQLTISHIDKKTSDSRALSSLSHQGTPSPDNSNEASTSLQEKRQPGPSDYELRRQANIAENEQLLASLGLSKGGSSFIGKTKKGKKGKGEKVERCAFFFFSSVYLIMIWPFLKKSDRGCCRAYNQYCWPG